MLPCFHASFTSPLSSRRPVLPNRVLNPAPSSVLHTPSAFRPPHLIFWCELLAPIPIITHTVLAEPTSPPRPLARPDAAHSVLLSQASAAANLGAYFLIGNAGLLLNLRLPHPSPCERVPPPHSPGSAGQTLNPGHASPYFFLVPADVASHARGGGPRALGGRHRPAGRPRTAVRRAAPVRQASRKRAEAE